MKKNLLSFYIEKCIFFLRQTQSRRDQKLGDYDFWLVESLKNKVSMLTRLQLQSD